MKVKLFSILVIMLFLCGCSNIKNESVEDVLLGFNNVKNNYNTYHTGYKYYLPVGLSVSNSYLYNDEISSSKYNYYLYVDIISYYNKTENTYEKCNDCYYSDILNYNNKNGYLEINLKENNQYLIEIMYNYAKIEVMVGEHDISLALDYAVSILKSVEYNDNIITNLLGEDVLSYQEEEYNIFNTTSTSESNYLKAIEADESEEENDAKDEDLVR